MEPHCHWEALYHWEFRPRTTCNLPLDDDPTIRIWMNEEGGNFLIDRYTLEQLRDAEDGVRNTIRFRECCQVLFDGCVGCFDLQETHNMRVCRRCRRVLMVRDRTAPLLHRTLWYIPADLVNLISQFVCEV